MNYESQPLGIDPVTVSLIGVAIARIGAAAYQRYKAGRQYREIREEAEKASAITRRTRSVLEAAEQTRRQTDTAAQYSGKINTQALIATGLVGAAAFFALR